MAAVSRKLDNKKLLRAERVNGVLKNIGKLVVEKNFIVHDLYQKGK